MGNWWKKILELWEMYNKKEDTAPDPNPEPDPTPPKPNPPAPPDPPKPEPTKYCTHFDHTNQNALGQIGRFAIIFCRDTPKFDSVRLEGNNLVFAGYDDGRPWWNNFYPGADKIKGPVSGDLVCTKGLETWTFKITTNPKQLGDCR